MTTLSICIPTRDNHEKCKKTIKGILLQDQTDFELLITDASKDTEALSKFISQLNDPRVRHIPVITKSRVDHWNRSLSECAGRWVTLISDSDHVDPKIVGFIQSIEDAENTEDTEVIGWNKISYDWPEHRTEVVSTKISLSNGAFLVDNIAMRKRFLGFEKEGLLPFNIYHGLVKRDLMERIRDRFGGVYFEHPITYYEFGFKILLEAKELAFCERALSVLNQYSEYLLSESTEEADVKYKTEQFYKDIELTDNLDVFPFKNKWSPKLFPAIVLNWLVHKYGDEFYDERWKQNFVKRREEECNGLFSQSRFEQLSGLYRQAIDSWDGGCYSRNFAPKFNHKFFAQKDLKGYFEEMLFIDKDALGATTPSEFYQAFENFVLPTGLAAKKVIDVVRHKA